MQPAPVVARSASGTGLTARLPLRTQLLLMLLSLLVLSVGSLFVLHLMSERQLLAQIRDYTEELSTALQITQEQPAATANPQEAVRAYAEKLRQLGVRDVSIADASEEIQASTNPRQVGRRLARRQQGPHEYVVRGVLGEETGPPGSHTISTLTVPIVVNDRRVGYVLITRHLDDFSLLARQALLSRLLATLAVFALGMLLSLFLSWRFSRPLRRLSEAAHRVASGDLTQRVGESGSAEIATLSRAFNDMLESLQEKRALEERLHFAERSTALGRLASAVAHEIRNPLNFIGLTIDHLRSRLAPKDAARAADFDRLLSSVRAEVNRLSRLTRDFLAVGKPMALDVRPCALDELLREVLALVEQKARDQNVAVDLRLEPRLPRTLADPELLKTCLLNLAINALDAMPAGGLLTASVTHRPRGENGRLEVEIRDTGTGMSPEAARAALEPYASTKEAGLGLGLPLTRKFVEDHGGRLDLETAPGRGTSVRFFLPLRPVPEPEAVTT